MLWHSIQGAGGTIGGGGGASAIYRGGIRSAAGISNYSIDMGTPEVGEIQVVGFVYQQTSFVDPTCSGSSLTLLSTTGIYNTYDTIRFYKLDSNVTGTTTFSATAYYRNSLFVWSVRNASTTLNDTGYNNEGANINTLAVPAGGVILAASNGGATIDVYPELVDTNDDPVAFVETTFYTSAGSSSNASAQTLDMRVSGDTASRTLLAAISFAPA